MEKDIDVAMAADMRSTMFPHTRWSLVKRATHGGQPLEIWIGLYWFPLYAWARRRGWKPEDAADEVQVFVEKVSRHQLLDRANPARGHLRSWLLKSFSNHLASAHRRSQRLKRGGCAQYVLVDWQNAEIAFQAEYSHICDPGKVFVRAWALTVIEEAMESLATHYRLSGRERLFHVLLPGLEAPLLEKSYAEAAADLGMTGAAVRQAATRFRQRYRRILLDVAARRLGITCEARLHEELREMLSG
jgi:RNA polymerase sigma-70 factor (ECF subfamily)